MEVASDCVARAVAHAVLSATAVRTPGVDLLCYRDAFPSAFEGREG
jgi:putative pantetheine hydrolase